MANSNPNAGRKKSTDKKIPVQVYIHEMHIKAIGGITRARDIARLAVEKAKKSA